MTPQILRHGGDYNPDQWLKHPEILADDLKYMQMVKANTFSVGIFAWAALEPREGEFTFGWLDRIMDDIAGIGGKVILATPSAARPAWLSQKYPEVNRTNHRREKMYHGARHNHCFSSPVYREKVGIINRKLAERYKKHPALLMWHISNEYNGECHCPLCQENFREWLRGKYGTIDALNDSYWAAFWSHLFSDFSQLESPTDMGEAWIHGLNLDWRRFVTHQTLDFYLQEIVPLRELTPDIPVTTNFMADFDRTTPFAGLDYAQFAPHVDVVSWDAYPPWHNDYETTAHLASRLALLNDYFRALKDAPWYLLESTPSQVNWQRVNRAKRPGMHKLSCAACTAHGADAIMYFQWRKSRGATEKLHGAVVDHDNSPENRVFRDVAEVGQMLENAAEIANSSVRAQVALLWDMENHWALDNAEGFSRHDKKYGETVHAHYRAFWNENIAVDVITPDKCTAENLPRYKILVLPMPYMLRESTMHALRGFVRGGGTLVTTYICAVADENDLCYAGFPPLMRELLGVRVSETDTLYPSQRNGIKMTKGLCEQSGGKADSSIVYEAHDYCAVIHPHGAEILGVYTEDFYAGGAAVTRNKFGEGAAYFIGARTEGADKDFLADFYAMLIADANLTRPPIKAPTGVSVQTRQNDMMSYHFVMNFTEQAQEISLDRAMYDLTAEQEIQAGVHILPVYGVMILR